MWHDDVEQWRVDDAVSGENVGYFYLDLYPRYLGKLSMCSNGCSREKYDHWTTLDNGQWTMHNGHWTLGCSIPNT